MKSSSQPPRKPCTLSDSVHRQLNMYAIAASAAGVGVLAVAQPAEGRIVYTPAHRHIGVNQRLDLHLDSEKITDFVFVDRKGTLTSQWYASLSVYGRRANEVVGYQTKTFHLLIVSALSAGVRIGPKTPSFIRKGGMAGCGTFMGSGSCGGRWYQARNRYLGLKFQISGETHYGWARLSIYGDFQSRKTTALLTGYAYETVPNKPIIAGQTSSPDVITLEPGSLGGLAAGHRGTSH